MPSKVINVFLKPQAIVTYLLTTLFGGGLNSFMFDFNDSWLSNAKSFVMAFIFGFIVCIVIGFLIYDIQLSKYKIWVRIIVLILFFATFYFGWNYYSRVNNNTYACSTNFKSKQRVIRGDLIPIPYDSLYKAKHFTNECYFLTEVGEGDSDNIYTSESLTKIRLNLTGTYFIFLTCFTALVYGITEIGKFKKKRIYTKSKAKAKPAQSESGSSPSHPSAS